MGPLIASILDFPAFVPNHLLSARLREESLCTTPAVRQDTAENSCLRRKAPSILKSSSKPVGEGRSHLAAGKSSLPPHGQEESKRRALSKPQSAYKEVLIAQEVRQAKARQLVAEVLMRHGMGSAEALDLAHRVPVLLGRILLEIRDADYAKYSQGQPIGEGLNSQIPDYMEERGLAKIVMYLHQLGVPPKVLGRVLNRRELFFSDVVAKVQFIQSLGVRPKKIAQVLKGCNRFFDLHLESMHEMVAYLMAMGARGCDIGHIIELYPPILSLSIRHRLQPMVQYLRGLGISQRGLTRIMRRYPRLLGLAVEDTLAPRVEFLQSLLGLTTAEVAQLATKCPHILGYGEGGNLAKIIELLRSLLFLEEASPAAPRTSTLREESGGEVRTTSEESTLRDERGGEVRATSEESTLREERGGEVRATPEESTLRGERGGKVRATSEESTLRGERGGEVRTTSEELGREERSQGREGIVGWSGESEAMVASSPPPSSLGGSLGAAQQVRRRKEVKSGEALLRKVVLRNPDVLLLHTERNLEPTFRFLGELGLSRTEIAQMIGRNAQVLLLSVDNNMRAKVAWLEGLGLSRADVARVVTMYPSILSLSPANLQRKVNFLVNDMGRSLQEVVRFPQYFGYDLTKRIGPRHRKLKENGLQWSLISMLTCPDPTFELRLKRRTSL